MTFLESLLLLLIAAILLLQVSRGLALSCPARSWRSIEHRALAGPAHSAMHAGAGARNAYSRLLEDTDWRALTAPPEEGRRIEES